MLRARMIDAPTLILALALDDVVLAAALWLAIPGKQRYGVRRLVRVAVVTGDRVHPSWARAAPSLVGHVAHAA